MLLQEIITKYKHPFPCPLHSWYRYIPFSEAIFLPFVLFFTLQKKTKTAIDYLDNRQISGQAEAQKACFLFPWSTRRVEPHLSTLPQQSQAFPLSIHSTALERHLSGILLTTRGKTGRNPTSSPSPNHLPSSTEAQHCTANGKAGNSIRAHPLHRTIQCTEKTDRASQLN